MKKRIKKEKINKKTIMFSIILIILFTILIFLSSKVLGFYFNKSACENSYLDFINKNPDTVFSIDKIVFFSNCNATNRTNSNGNFIIENLYQYTDMALFINNNSEQNTLENTLKKLKISNFQYITKPEIGIQKIFYKNINSFAESNIPEETNAFENELEFNISSNDNEDLSTPTLYNNCANPIVLSYINDNLTKDFAIADISSITYDGSLLKKCGIPITSLNSRFSFDIYITNNLDQEFKCSVYIEPPIENAEKTLSDGSITLTTTPSYKFIRYK